MKLKIVFLPVVIAISLSITASAQAVSIQDSIALVDLYKGTNGSHWTRHDNWLTGPVSTWYGITLTERRVKEVRLPANNLTGPLAASIGNLDSATFIDFSGNKLSGSIPSSIGKLTRIFFLYMGGNQFTGSIPSSIGDLPNLAWLILAGNRLSGNIPASFSHLGIEILNLGLNKLSGPIPTLNPRHSEGFECYIADNQFTFAGMEELVMQKIVYPSIELRYWPQAIIPVHQQNNILSVSAGGTLSNNTYTWFRVGKAGSTVVKGDSSFYPPEPGKYYAEVTNSICTYLTLRSDTIAYKIPLPVTIADLIAYQQGKQNCVAWTSVTELNIEHYEIQRSSNARDFVSVGLIQAKGNGTTKTAYSFLDNNPSTGNNYYRLKIFDGDGETSFSTTVLTKAMLTTGGNTLIYPLPASTTLTIETNALGSFTMTDQSGRLLSTTVINYKGFIDVSRLNAGTYYLRNNNTGEVRKVIIAR